MTRLLAIFLACLGPLLAAAETAAVRIMAVGDSITQGGGKTFATYRIPLADKLKAAGLRFEFVGSQKTETPQGPLWHEGYGGKNAEYLASILEARLKAHPADVLMLQAGHNHFVEEKPVAGIVAAHREMVATARRLNAKSIVFIAQVIPSGKLPKYAYIPELNAALAGLVKELHRPDQPVYLVDLATGFDPAKDTIADLVHPSAAGAEKIAQRWSEALVKGLRK
jgi:lysophospholipase L1-like esterase